MIKKILTALILITSVHTVFAQSGYDIKVTFKEEIPDSKIYLARYFAKSLPTVYFMDSAVVINKKEAHFKRKDNLLGGLYLVLFNNKSKWIDIVMKDGLKLDILLDNNNIYSGSTIKGDNENIENAKFQIVAEKFAAESKRLNTLYEKSASKEDSLKNLALIKKNNEDFLQKRRDIAAANPNNVLSKLFNALERPQAPEGIHYKEDGKTVDSFYGYYYVKNHFWDKFDFSDDRLIHAPIYDSKLKDYFDNYTLSIPDSFNYEADKLLAKMKPKSELFKYTLHFLGNYTKQHKIMGMDESFVYLVENYFMKGYGHWLDSTQLKEYYIIPAQKIAPNVIGNKAPELELVDAYTLAPRKLSDFDAEYTLLIFWDISCGYCEKELPLMDSIYRNELKDKGVKVYSMAIGSDLNDIHKKIDRLNIKHWSQNIDVNATSGYKSKYNVYSTPVMYILDKDKKIRGKNFNHSTVSKLFEYIRKKDSNSKT